MVIYILCKFSLCFVGHTARHKKFKFIHESIQITMLSNCVVLKKSSLDQADTSDIDLLTKFMDYVSPIY